MARLSRRTPRHPVPCAPCARAFAEGCERPRQRKEVSMENPRPEKVAVVDEVRERFANSSAALLTEYRGLDVAALAELRRALREAGGEYKIYKNTLVRFAARDV